MQQTKELLILNEEQKDIIRKWYRYVSTMTTADNAVIFKINYYKTILLNICDCSIIIKWWSYLPDNLITADDINLHEELSDFTYGR